RQASAEDWGWAGWARGGVRVTPLPGNHYTLLTEPNVRAVREHVRHLLESRSDEQSHSARKAP
ncbi:MAG TPA: hypothetical protein VEZ71_19630, partial [Archangium sp.]|nr:hypothetical protein [Archangium sp.]